MLFQLKIVYVKRTPKPRASFHTVAVVAVTVFIDRLLKRKTVVLLLCPPRAVLTIHSPLSVVFNYLWPQTLAAAHFVLPLKGNTPLWKVDLIANSTAISLLVIVAKTNLPCMNIRIMDVNLFELQFPLPNTLPLKTQLSMAVSLFNVNIFSKNGITAPLINFPHFCGSALHGAPSSELPPFVFNPCSFELSAQECSKGTSFEIPIATVHVDNADDDEPALAKSSSIAPVDVLLLSSQRTEANRSADAVEGVEEVKSSSQSSSAERPHTAQPKVAEVLSPRKAMSLGVPSPYGSLLVHYTDPLPSIEVLSARRSSLQNERFIIAGIARAPSVSAEKVAAALRSIGIAAKDDVVCTGRTVFTFGINEWSRELEAALSRSFVSGLFVEGARHFLGFEQHSRPDFSLSLILCGLWASSSSMEAELLRALDVQGAPTLEVMLDRRNFPWTHARFRTLAARAAFQARLKSNIIADAATPQWLRCMLLITPGNFTQRRQRICGNSQHDRMVMLRQCATPPDELLRQLSEMTVLLTARRPFVKNASRRAAFVIITCATASGARALCDTSLTVELVNGSKFEISCTRPGIRGVLSPMRTKHIHTSAEARLCNPECRDSKM